MTKPKRGRFEVGDVRIHLDDTTASVQSVAGDAYCEDPAVIDRDQARALAELLLSWADEER